ncbi:Protein TPX2 [Linum perenne]
MEDGNCKANLNMEDHARVADVNNPSGTPTLAHENQAIKRQELEDGKSRQIPNLKPPQPLTHKSRLGLSTCNSNTGSITASIIQKEERKVYVREPAIQTPFISTVEMMNIFWKLHVYQKYQEALHSHPNFRSSILRQQHQKRFVRFVKPFHLNAIYQETPRNKSLYLFESKGELGIFCNTKKQVTVPKEFHFAIDERIPPPNAVADMFDKVRDFMARDLFILSTCFSSSLGFLHNHHLREASASIQPSLWIPPSHMKPQPPLKQHIRA